ncbi:MAG: helix-turn-helix domain-containing protein [Acidimicrobiales bacterium]
MRDTRRAEIVLLCAAGVPLRQIAERVGMDQHQVGVWRRRFLADPIDGLVDRPRSGRPWLGHDERMAMAAIATSEPDPWQELRAGRRGALRTGPPPSGGAARSAWRPLLDA